MRFVQKKEYTVMTRFRLTKELETYLHAFVTEYNKIYRYMWKKMTATDYAQKYPKDSYFITEICQKFGLLKRTVNSLRYDIKGRMKAYMELKKTEREQLVIKITLQEKKVAEITETVNKLKALASKNKLNEKQLNTYRKLKQSLYWQKNKWNKRKQNLSRLDYQIKNNVYSMGFGGKDMFCKQYHLSENGYKTHKKWYHDFVKARDKNIFYLGSSDETQGNQLFQMTYNKDIDDFSFRLRKENAWCTGSKQTDNYIQMEHINFKHLHEELKAEVLLHQNKQGTSPLTYRFHREGTKWYMQVIFPLKCKEYETYSKYGVIGLDYNDGFIELSETDEKGNLVYQKHYDLNYHGCGAKAENEMRNVVHKICAYAKRKGKDIAIEDLSFQKTKAKTEKAKSVNGKAYNQMLHLFDYRRYIDTMRNTSHRMHIFINIVKAYHTSKIGKKKYCEKKKLNVHQAASYVIARRGQGFLDKCVV